VAFFTSAKEFKAALVDSLEKTTEDDRIRVQAYHFDCDRVAQALINSRASLIDILADSKASREAKRTKELLEKMSRSGVDVRVTEGKDMASLYGRSGIIGVHHAKALAISSPGQDQLWLGSCNFTQASEYNVELMVCLCFDKVVAGPHSPAPLRPIYEKFLTQFVDLHGAAPLFGEVTAESQERRTRIERILHERLGQQDGACRPPLSRPGPNTRPAGGSSSSAGPAVDAEKEIRRLNLEAADCVGIHVNWLVA
jgi:hypothetical protein